MTRASAPFGSAPPQFVRLVRLLFLRRLIAACLAVSLGFFSAESLTAEVHDGDATHAELVQADGVREHGAAHHAALVVDSVDEGQSVTSTAARTADGAHARGGALGLGHAASASAAATPSHEHGGHGSGAPEHATHVCHCGHAHVAPLPLAEAIPRPAVGRYLSVPIDELVVLLSRAAEPALRPPIG